MADDATIDKFLDAFLAGKADAADKPEFEELAAIVAMTYAKSAWRTAFERGAKEPPRPKLRDESAVLDIIMTRSYPGEELDISLSRLLKAVQTLGFPYLNAFSAAAAYNTFPHLSEIPYEPRAKRRKARSAR